MTVAELERPLCPCHGVPQHKVGGVGVYWRCSVEAREYHRAWREANRERWLEGASRWHAENRDASNARKRERNAADPQPARDRAKRWREENLESARERARLYRQSPEGRSARRAAHARRRALKAGAAIVDFVDGRDREAILAEYGDRCAYCGAGGPLELDHWIPLVRGGDHSRRNLVPACRACNGSKHDQTGAEYQIRRLEEASS